MTSGCLSPAASSFVWPDLRPEIAALPGRPCAAVKASRLAIHIRTLTTSSCRHPAARPAFCSSSSSSSSDSAALRRPLSVVDPAPAASSGRWRSAGAGVTGGSQAVSQLTASPSAASRSHPDSDCRLNTTTRSCQPIAFCSRSFVAARR